jgi:hypothetical protein
LLRGLVTLQEPDHAINEPNDSDDGKQAKGVRIVLIEVLVDESTPKR